MRTPVVITGGGGPAVQRVAYGTTAGAVRLRLLESGAPVGPEEGIGIVDAAVDSNGPEDTFGTGAVAAGFADTSLPGRLGVLYVVHNDGEGVEIARLDLASGAPVDATDPPVAGSLGCRVNGSPVLSPPTASGSRILFVAVGGDSCLYHRLVRIPIEGDAASPAATIGAQTFQDTGALAPGAGPSLVVLADAAGAPRFHVALGRAGGVDFYDASVPLPAPPAYSVALAGETAMTVSAAATASGAVAGAEGSGTPAAPALYVAAKAGADAIVHRLVQRGGAVVVDRSAPLLGTPAPALTVAESMTPAGPTAGGRLVVTTAQGITLLRTADLAGAMQIPGAFARTTAAVSGPYAFAMRDDGEHLVLRMDSGAVLSRRSSAGILAGEPPEAAGQPAIARGLVVFGSPAGAFAYATRDVTPPSVEWVEPAPAGGLSAGARISATAADDRGVASVAFRLIGATAAHVIARAAVPEAGSPFDGGGRFTAPVDLTSVPPGEYDVDAVATDPAGNSAAATPRRVTVVAGGAGAAAGGRCLHLVAGTARADRLTGTARGDRIRGGGGNDRLSGGAGADCLYGQRGNDRLSGGSGNDRLSGGPGRNRFSGGSGADTILARNGRRDVVRCGRGRDRVIADRTDRAARDCERVRRARR